MAAARIGRQPHPDGMRTGRSPDRADGPLSTGKPLVRKRARDQKTRSYTVTTSPGASRVAPRARPSTGLPPPLLRNTDA